jgi:hypothetical protein
MLIQCLYAVNKNMWLLLQGKWMHSAVSNWHDKLRWLFLAYISGLLIKLATARLIHFCPAKKLCTCVVFVVTLFHDE